MRLIIMKNDDDVSDWAAKYVIKRINEYKPSADKYVAIYCRINGAVFKLYTIA